MTIYSGEVQFIHTHSRDALKTKGVHAYQLFENEYTRQKNTNKYYELLK